MWRPPHGGSVRPGQCRPVAGFGRPVGRPGPEPSRERRLLGRPARADAGCVAGVTGVAALAALEGEREPITR